MANPSTRYFGWFRDIANSRHSALYEGTRRMSVDSGGADVNGTLGVSGTATFAGATAFAGAMTGARMQVSITSADTASYSAGDSGIFVLATKSSATQVFTLPTATLTGFVITFKCGNAGGEILINPTSSDDMQCKATNDGGANVVTTGTTGLKNTAATNVLGDYLTLVADGVDKWHTVAQSGIWAGQ